MRIESEDVSGEFLIVVRYRPGGLVLREYFGAPEVTVPVGSITHLDVYRGMRSWGKEGAVVGALVGVIGGTVTAQAAVESKVGLSDIEQDIKKVGVAGLGGVVGAVSGWLIGRALSGSTWEDISVGERIGIAPSADGVLALGYEYRF